MASNATSHGTCPAPMVPTSNGVWQGDRPIDFAVPLLIIQICLVLLITRILAFFLRYLRQPRVIAEIIGGILLGPSALGRNSRYLETIFPRKSIPVLDSVADVGLIFFLFLVGLELDLQAIRRTGRQALSIAAAGICLPFAAGVGVSVVLHRTIAGGGDFVPFLVFMGVAMSITAFPVLARILAERRLLTTDVGQMAMSAAAVNDVVAWILLALAVALSGTGKSPAIAAWVLLSGVAFVVIMFIVVSPIMAWLARQAIENEPINETHVCITLAGVLAAGFITDSIGIHSIFGGFVFGLVIPKDGPFAGILIEKIEDLVTILMLPLYFASSGLKTNIGSINGALSGGLLVLVITTACAGKILGTFIVALLHNMKIRKSLTLGFLMNTKGLVELIVLNIGKDRKVLNDETFAIMVLMALFTTFVTTPVVMALYKPARNPVPYTRRKVDVAEPDDHLRILACVHGITNVHAIINLVEASRGSRKPALRLYILHLVELSERSSVIMRVQRARKNGRPFWNKSSQGRDNIVVAFEAYGQLSKVAVRPMTAISNFADMHEDICTIAVQKRAAIIILPFHKHIRPADGVLESHNPGFRTVNQHVLLYAPCSVGILIDRGIGVAALSSSDVDHNIAVLFFGGPDDREALAFGYRMAEHPGIRLTVFRFVYIQNQDQSVTNAPQSNATDMRIKSSRFSAPHFVVDEQDYSREQQLDEECLVFAMHQRGVEGNAGQSQSIFYEECTIDNPLDSASKIGKNSHFNLIVVGRARRPALALTHLANHPLESAELGPIGDVLCDREVQASILVIQQHDPMLVHELPSIKSIDMSASSIGLNVSESVPTIS